MALIYSAEELKLLVANAVVHGLSKFKYDNISIRPSHLDSLVAKIYEELTALDAGVASPVLDLGDVSDINITTPSNGDLLSYTSGGDGGWINQTPAIQTSTISLNASEIQGLNTTPKQIVATPGAGLAHIAIGWSIRYTYNTTIFDVGTRLELVSGTNTNPQLVLPSLLTNLLERTSSTNFASTQSPTTSVDTNFAANEALFVRADADSTAGDGTAIVTVYYTTIAFT